MPKTWDYLDEFCKEVLTQLRDVDYPEWGDSWLKAASEGMDGRIAHHIEDYFLKFRMVGTPIPWKKVAGYALIAWIHNKHPELWGT